MPEVPSRLSELSPLPRQPSTLPNGQKIIRQPDGTILIQGGESGPRIPREGDFDENLAGLFNNHERLAIADLLMEFKQADLESRKDWEEREQRALEIMGIKDIPKDKDRGPGVHDIRHPVIAMACVQYHSRQIAEYFPPSGPVKGAVIGKADKEREAQAQRIETFMNYYLTEVDRGYYEDCNQMFFYLPISGCAFKKCSPDWRTGLPQIRYIKATNFIAPYMGTDLATMPRYAHAYTMTGQDLNRAMAIGTLFDTELTRPSPGEAKHSRTADTADLRQPIMHQDDELYPMLEYHVEMALDSEELPEDERGVVLPWVILIEEANREVLLVRRNWKQDDVSRMKRLWFVKYGFLPGLGFYDFGFPHLIGSLGLAASGAVNALLDSALMSNMPAGFIAKEGKGLPGGEVMLEPGVFKQVDLPAEDLAKMFYKPEVGHPEPALFQLLEHLVNTAQLFSSTTEVMTGEAPNNAPVGTTVALIEESSRVQTAIHKRTHASAKEEFRMLAEFIFEYMPDQYEYDRNEETRFLLKSDFDGRVDVRPVSDPNIFSSTQRIALCQAVIELQNTRPDLYSKDKQVAAHRRLLEALRVPDPDEVAPEDTSAARPKYLDPVSENQMVAMGSPVHAFPHQDHQAHITVHHNFLQHIATVQMPPEELQQVVAAMSAHLREHAGLNYRNLVMQSMGMELPPFDPQGENEDLPPDIERGISVMAANHLPPPPMTDEQQAAAGEGQAVLDKERAKLKALDEQSQAKIERETAAFIAEQQREEVAFDREENRKDQATIAQLVREKAQSQIQEARDRRTSNLQHVDTLRGLQSKEAERRLKIKDMQVQSQLKAKAAKQASAAKKSAAKKKSKPRKG